MSSGQPNNPLHGVTLEAMLEHLVARHGWEELSARIAIRCFSHEPTIKSSLKFLRHTDWARSAVEQLYLADLTDVEVRRKKNKARAARRAHAAAQGASEASATPPTPEAPSAPLPRRED